MGQLISAQLRLEGPLARWLTHMASWELQAGSSVSLFPFLVGLSWGLWAPSQHGNWVLRVGIQRSQGRCYKSSCSSPRMSQGIISFPLHPNHLSKSLRPTQIQGEWNAIHISVGGVAKNLWPSLIYHSTSKKRRTCVSENHVLDIKVAAKRSQEQN